MGWVWWSWKVLQYTRWVSAGSQLRPIRGIGTGPGSIRGLRQLGWETASISGIDGDPTVLGRVEADVVDLGLQVAFVADGT